MTAVKRFSMGLNVVRDVHIPGTKETVHKERSENVESPKKKRKRDNGEVDGDTPKKHKEKKPRDGKHDKHDKHDKSKDKHHKETDKKKDKGRQDERKEKHKYKDRSDKGDKPRH